MTNVIRIKRRLAGGAAGAPASLKTGELAWNQQDNTLYGGYGVDGGGNSTSIVVLGGTGTFAQLSSPAFTGTPTAPTAAVDTNTTQLATTAFVLAQASSATPAAHGSAAVGTSTRYARADHVHAMPVLSALGTPTADVAMGGFKITGLGTPTATTDA